MGSLPWITAVVAISLLGIVLLSWSWQSRRSARVAPLPTEWALSARPVFSTDERRVYQLLREALPHHIVLSKLPLVRFCQPNDPGEVRYWYDLLGSIHVTFAVCSANGRVLAAIDLDTDRGNSRRILQIKQSVLGACRVRYLRCPVDNLPSAGRAAAAGAAQRRPRARAASPSPPTDLDEARDSLASTVASRRAQRTALWQDSVAASRTRSSPPTAGWTASAAASSAPAAARTRRRSRRPHRNAQPAGCAERPRSTRPQRRRPGRRRRGRRSGAGVARAIAPLSAAPRGVRIMTDETPDDALPTAPYADLTPAVGARRARRRRPARRRPPAAAQLVREPRLPGRSSRTAASVVAKFYRPGRWSDAQILEEHAFAAELAAAEIPVARRCRCARSRLAARDAISARRPDARHRRDRQPAYRFGVAPRRAGRAPELDDPETLRWLGRFIGRLHAVGARAAVRAPASTLDVDSLRRRQPRLAARACEHHAARQRRRLARRSSTPRSPPSRRLRRRRRCAPCACTATAISATCCGPSAARTSSTSTTPSTARRCRTCGCCSRATARRCAPAARRARGLRDVHGLRLARAAPDRAAAHPAHDPPQRLDRAALGTTRRSRSPSRGSPAPRTGPSRRAPARAARGDGRAAARQPGLSRDCRVARPSAAR